MLHLPISHVRRDSLGEGRVSRRTDRAMDVLQYGLAGLALLVAALLAVFR